MIPKPAARAPFRVKGWGMRRGGDALIYFVPNRRDPSVPYEKGVTSRELRAAYHQLMNAGELTHQWFDRRLPGCAAEGSCNFTTIGGLFVLLRAAEYAGPGVYRRTRG